MKVVIAIDGPAGSGKSTCARAVAKALGYVFIDSGAMYRAVTYNVIAKNIDADDQAKVIEVAKTIQIQLLPHPEHTIIHIDGVDRSQDIRKAEVTAKVSKIAGISEVRSILVSKQQELGKKMVELRWMAETLVQSFFPKLKLKYSC